MGFRLRIRACLDAAESIAPRRRRPGRCQDAFERALDLHNGPPRQGNGQLYDLRGSLEPQAHRPCRALCLKLTGLAYEDACHLLFEVIEYVEPRLLTDQTYPPVVGMAVTRAKYGLSNEEAEARL